MLATAKWGVTKFVFIQKMLRNMVEAQFEFGAIFEPITQCSILGFSFSPNWFVHSEKKDGTDVPEQMTTGMWGASCVALVFRV